jgi:hypothetical protein
VRVHGSEGNVLFIPLFPVSRLDYPADKCKRRAANAARRTCNKLEEGFDNDCLTQSSLTLRHSFRASNETLSANEFSSLIEACWLASAGFLNMEPLALQGFVAGQAGK